MIRRMLRDENVTITESKQTLYTTARSWCMWEEMERWVAMFISDSNLEGLVETEGHKEMLKELEMEKGVIYHSGTFEKIVGTSLEICIFWRSFLALMSRLNVGKSRYIFILIVPSFYFRRT